MAPQSRDHPVHPAPVPRTTKRSDSPGSTAPAANLSFMREKFERIYHASPVPRAIARAMAGLPKHPAQASAPIEHLSAIVPSSAYHQPMINEKSEDTGLPPAPCFRETALTFAKIGTPLSHKIVSVPTSCEPSHPPPRLPYRMTLPKDISSVLELPPHLVQNSVTETKEADDLQTIEQRKGRLRDENEMIDRYPATMGDEVANSESIASIKSVRTERRKPQRFNAGPLSKRLKTSNSVENLTTKKLAVTVKSPTFSQEEAPRENTGSKPRTQKATTLTMHHSQSAILDIGASTKRSERTTLSTAPSAIIGSLGEGRIHRGKQAKQHIQNTERSQDQAEELSIRETSRDASTQPSIPKRIILEELKFGKQHIPQNVLEATGSSWETGRRHSRRKTTGTMSYGYRVETRKS